ncbi:MAG: gliding motility-associated C-terminal domain-containing protein, partial [Bacteroidota bacterium]|nr:gliding motility-associated C-terminal domain-containing protein [Bacteroidota bacterium]
GYTFVSDDSAGSFNPNNGRWNIGNIAAGAQLELNVVVQVNPSGDYNNIAEVIAAILFDLDSTPNNNVILEDDQDEQATNPRHVTDISVTKTADNMSPDAGSEIVFTIVVANDGPNDATGLIIEDQLPSGYNFVSATTTSGVYDEIAGSWDLPNLANGASETLEVRAVVLSSGSYVNTAELIALDTYDPDSTPNNNLGSEDDQSTVIPVPQGLSDLSLSKMVDNVSPNVGDVVRFVISVTNNGPTNASGVMVTDLLPQGFSYQSHFSTAGVYNPNSGVWNINRTILNQDTESLEVLVIVNAPTGTEGEYVNQAYITASNFMDPDSNPSVGPDEDDFLDGIVDDDEASASVIPQTTDISITKTVNNMSPSMGNEVVFTITATNQGNLPATIIGIEDQLPSGYEFVSSVASIGTYDNSGIWEITILQPDEIATLDITVKVLDVEDYLNRASLAYVDQWDTDESNNMAEAYVVPTCLVVYNEFSPNGDGVNDYFKIDCITQYPNNSLQVYNRWGNIVFETRSYKNDWDGTPNGRAIVQKEDQLPVGTYYYILDLGDGSEPRTDWLYINR